MQFVFASGAQTALGDELRRLPLAVEVVVRAAVMTAAIVVVGLALQFLLYAAPYQLHWLTRGWLETDLPRMVILGFGLSLIIGMGVELERLIGAPLLASVLLGTYHRPSRQQRIVMFLDLANSTRLAEAMGELRVHDLITRFFFDIDEPILDHRGEVHAYVGDEVIVSWPLVRRRESQRARLSRAFLRSTPRSLASRRGTDWSSGSPRHFAQAFTQVRSSSANAATPSASSPFSAIR